ARTSRGGPRAGAASRASPPRAPAARARRATGSRSGSVWRSGARPGRPGRTRLSRSTRSGAGSASGRSPASVPRRDRGGRSRTAPPGRVEPREARIEWRRARRTTAPGSREAGRDRTRPTRSPRHRPPGSSCASPRDLAPRSRVEDLLLRQPGAAGDGDAVIDVVERAGRVRVAVDAHGNAGLGGQAGVYVAEVEPVGLRVDLERGPGRGAAPRHPLHVDLRTRPTRPPSPGPLADAVDVGVLDGLENPLGGTPVE